MSSLSFEPVTIFASPNGCGKTTLLEIIHQKLTGPSDDEADLFQNYVKACEAEMSYLRPNEICFLSSDDVFDELLNKRAINAGVNRRKEELAQEYLKAKYSENVLYHSDDETYEKLKRQIEARSRAQSRYIRTPLANNTIVMSSNGETAISFFEQKIHEHSLYLLDEPENSLSAESQLKLKEFIEVSVQFYDCQFIIVTHSPFITAIDHARIYDFSFSPVQVRKWSELESIRTYYHLFLSHKNEF
ncbi:MAG: AAA family ATPase [Solobacterium sp.]|jgi:predicted ATPase|nr:AAA family ATPase [Solobacterium sp.]MCH4049005.1 AAA family ATPase [Solobacterium sp.]MCH4074241.1 AAA family ATPase [Solobacterium sp.]MCI1313562.1 AAA family ATPase [Solobacterium sp.]MCI1345730.1 AAA family ATPase [Solobacterium sp.]